MFKVGISATNGEMLCALRKKNSWPVHDSEAVQVQGRGCHPRGQARGFECWVHIWQSPLKLQGGLENGFQCFLCIQGAAAAPRRSKICTHRCKKISNQIEECIIMTEKPFFPKKTDTLTASWTKQCSQISLFMQGLELKKNKGKVKEKRKSK